MTADSYNINYYTVVIYYFSLVVSSRSLKKDKHEQIKNHFLRERTALYGKNGFLQFQPESLSDRPIYFFNPSKYTLVSATTTPLNATSAIRFGIAISPLNISAMVHTALTVM